MTVQILYEMLHGDYCGVLKRLHTDERILHYLNRFIDDYSITEIYTALSRGNVKTIKIKTVALKGLASSLGFSELEKCVNDFYEDILDNRFMYVRNFGTMISEYNLTVNSIKLLLEQDNKKQDIVNNGFE